MEESSCSINTVYVSLENVAAVYCGYWYKKSSWVPYWAGFTDSGRCYPYYFLRLLLLCVFSNIFCRKLLISNLQFSHITVGTPSGPAPTRLISVSWKPIYGYSFSGRWNHFIFPKIFPSEFDHGRNHEMRLIGSICLPVSLRRPVYEITFLICIQEVLGYKFSLPFSIQLLFIAVSFSEMSCWVHLVAS
jgi:hypothetical protein